ncbi:MAG: SUMF1/EgtB/PvdO family nonheme iron enzyme [Betaproteobacteria bacterium]|nr:MAG: SUMF1/EgtB/PvdO family nonheme iron enzyme [Betaproteobacteria bacterium]
MDSRRSVLSLLCATVTLALCLAAPSARGQDRQTPGSEFQDCPDCPVMVIIPPGRYGMPMPPIDQGRPFTEGENRLVNITEPFAVGKFEVTFDQWDACVADGKCAAAEDEGWGKGKRPVINISWIQAYRYTRWLSEKTGKNYRLPTEAEWEYSARAGAGRARFLGIEPEEVCRYANVYDMTAEKELEFGMEMLPCDDGFDVTAPVGSFKPNAFGLHDMLGNVWEWTEDCQAVLWRNAPTDSSARVDGKCSERAYRGSSWLSHPPPYIQVGDRYRFLGARYNDLGFRVARSLE